MTASDFGEIAPDRLTLRSVATRAKLISVAEKLFASRGVDGVTLNEIGKQAGQRNAAVCQYHFGSKEGLLQAIIDKHVPGIVARRHALLDRIEQQEGGGGLPEVVQAFVRPVAEKMLDPDGGRDFVRINAQLVALHTAVFQHLGASYLKLPNNDRLIRALHATLIPLGLPEAVLKQRTMLAAVLLFHGLADYDRMQEAANQPDAARNSALFVNTLENAMLAMLSSPA